MDTTLNITSFGEDEAGEIYVLGQSGVLNRMTISPSPPACSYSVSSTNQFFPQTGGEGVFTLTTAGDCGWIAAATVDWITLAQTRGVGGGALSFAVRDNPTGSPRMGLIQVGGRSLTIVQDGSASGDCFFNINPAAQNFNSLGGSGSINIIVEERCAWIATPSASWITITSSNIGIGNGAVNFSVASNTTGVSRKGTITIGNQMFRIKQK
jgi:hypothetical protein